MTKFIRWQTQWAMHSEDTAIDQKNPKHTISGI